MHDKNTAVIGLQWGDEGKGKIVDYLSSKFDAVARFNGGNNAGHTVIVDNKTYKLRILPSGILRDDVLSVIGNGVVLDPYHLIEEIKLLKSQGVNIDAKKLLISENCHLVLPFHKSLDELFEKSQKIGTTKCGIGPCYEDKVARRGIRLYDLKNKKILEDALERSLSYHNVLRKGFGVEPLIAERLLEDLLHIGQQILQYSFCLDELHSRLKNKKILFEGAQGMLLDIDHGTYPFVTSSSLGAGQTVSGTGFDMPKNVLGILKCYSTRVGSGGFPTEQKNQIGESLQSLGNELGTVSGRKRRCGWFDAVLARHSSNVAKASGLVLTKMDVLDSFEKIKICNSYKINGKSIDTCSMNMILNEHIEPEYMELDGWGSETSNIEKYSNLPIKARLFVEKVEELIRIPVVMISTGANRESIIQRDSFIGL